MRFTDRRSWLWAEFVCLFVLTPVVIAVFMPPRAMFLALFAFSLAGLVLLWRTGGFDWRGLLRGWRRIPWGKVAAVGLIVLVSGWIILSINRPQNLFSFLLTDPARMLLVWAFYPFLSALPQELIFRVLFFHRYAALFPQRRPAILVNAAIFSLAHLMYWSPIVAVLTFLGGIVFARGYLERGFPTAWLMHAVAGNVLFAVGMGVYFYSGNVVRPF
ncbi:CPBP family intramembrane glutamic endopeptidase [Paracoccus pacificus]|uniref:CPBP family intramembrane glutamic endopeptidase n=1 Tax=Paracoccus pacificus TaxID=1463598 RepID=A0ABW4RBW0_9RHOB